MRRREPVHRPERRGGHAASQRRNPARDQFWREHLFEIAQRESIDVREATLRDEDLFAAEEAFLTGTTREIVPIVTVNDRTIGPGRPGPTTGRLLDAFRRSIL